MHKLSIRATDGPEKLLKVIKNPVTDHLPVGARRIGLSHKGDKLVRINDYVKELPDEPVVFVCGCFAHGKIEADYVDEFIAVSEYPLSASVVLGKLCTSFEEKWNVL